MSAYVRKGINGLLIFAVLYYFFVFFLIPNAKKYFNNLLPGETSATVLFGKLDPLEFKEMPLLNANPRYELNTKDGKLPSLPDKLPVYKYKQPRFSYSDGTAAQTHASVLGFTDDDLITDLKGEKYSWRNSRTGAVLDIYVHSKELTVNTPLLGRSGFFIPGSINEEEAKQAAKDLLIAINRFTEPSYVSGGKQRVRLGHYVGQQLVETKNPREAQIARVDLYRTIFNLQVLGPDPNKGLLHVYVGAQDNEIPVLRFPKIEAYYWEIEAQSNATYPLVPISQVWKEVSAGRGIIASVIPKDANPFEDYQPARVDRILINNIYLAYYDTPKLQKYLQPIYVFEGNYVGGSNEAGSITIYYPAISGQWINEPASGS